MDEDLASLVIIAFHDGILLRWFMNMDPIDGKAYVDTFKKDYAQWADRLRWCELR